MNIGRVIKDLREQKGTSQKEMAANLGITRSALWKIENGKVWPKKTTIDKFCLLIGIPVAYLYQKAFTIEDYIWPE